MKLGGLNSPTFSRSFWIFSVLWISVWILGSACPFLQRGQLGFWYKLLWMYRSVLGDTWFFLKLLLNGIVFLISFQVVKIIASVQKYCWFLYIHLVHMHIFYLTLSFFQTWNRLCHYTPVNSFSQSHTKPSLISLSSSKFSFARNNKIYNYRLIFPLWIALFFLMSNICLDLILKI